MSSATTTPASSLPIVADLHTHTSRSDGSYAPGEVVRAAAALGLSAVAITDHDTIAGLSPARLEAERLGLILVPGVELTVHWRGREFHLLAYGFREEDPGLNAMLDGLAQARVERLRTIVANLEHRHGVVVEFEAVRAGYPRAALGRGHLADHLVTQGVVASRRDAFDRFLGDDQLDLPRPSLDLEQAIHTVRQAGGFTALAHPPRDLDDSQWVQWRDLGMEAVETRWPAADRNTRVKMGRLARRLGFEIVAGSDFHHPGRAGRHVGAVGLGPGEWERLRDRLRGATIDASATVESIPSEFVPCADSSRFVSSATANLDLN